MVEIAYIRFTTEWKDTLTQRLYLFLPYNAAMHANMRQSINTIISDFNVITICFKQAHVLQARKHM